MHHPREDIGMSEGTGKARPQGFARTVVANVGGWTRFIITLPVIGLLVGATVLVVVGSIETVHILGKVLGLHGEEPLSLKLTMVSFIEMADVYLLAVVLYIIGLGLFELFIDADLKLPHWLSFNDLDDLKSRLIGVVAVVLSVLFLGRAIESTDSWGLFLFGAAAAMVIGSLALFVKLSLHDVRAEGETGAVDSAERAVAAAETESEHWR
jgi:uncharacterized membrane protein YqhA